MQTADRGESARRTSTFVLGRAAAGRLIALRLAAKAPGKLAKGRRNAPGMARAHAVALAIYVGKGLHVIPNARPLAVEVGACLRQRLRRLVAPGDGLLELFAQAVELPVDLGSPPPQLL